MHSDSPPPTARRGRPHATTALEIRSVALDLFVRDGYDATNVDDIAMALGIGRTTFFRYFTSKSSVVWHDLDDNFTRLTTALGNNTSGPVLGRIRFAVLHATAYDESDRDFVQIRNALVARTPQLSHEGAALSARWAEAIADTVRPQLSKHSHPAMAEAVGFAIMGATTATLQLWSGTHETSMSDMLRSALDGIIPALQAVLDAGDG